MHKFFKWFTYKKVAVIKIDCRLPYNNSVITYTHKCYLYENPFGERKCSLSFEYFPLACISKNEELIKRFMQGSCTPEIPSYTRIKEKQAKPAVFEDIAVL